MKLNINPYEYTMTPFEAEQLTLTIYNQKLEYVKEKRKNVYVLHVLDFVEFQSEKHVRIFHELEHAPKDAKLKIIVRSHGGYINQGVALFETIIAGFNPENIEVYLHTYGYSMGSIFFCLFHESKRVITPFAHMMIHYYSGGYAGKGNEIEIEAQFKKDYIQNIMRHAYLTKGYLTKEEFRAMIEGKDYWFDAKEMCKRGIATHVQLENNRLISAKKFLKGRENE